jgi:hypothetical protein
MAAQPVTPIVSTLALQQHSCKALHGILSNLPVPVTGQNLPDHILAMIYRIIRCHKCRGYGPELATKPHFAEWYIKFGGDLKAKCGRRPRVAVRELSAVSGLIKAGVESLSSAEIQQHHSRMLIFAGEPSTDYDQMIECLAIDTMPLDDDKILAIMTRIEAVGSQMNLTDLVSRLKVRVSMLYVLNLVSSEAATRVFQYNKLNGEDKNFTTERVLAESTVLGVLMNPNSSLNYLFGCGGYISEDVILNEFSQHFYDEASYVEFIKKQSQSFIRHSVVVQGPELPSDIDWRAYLPADITVHDGAIHLNQDLVEGKLGSSLSDDDVAHIKVARRNQMGLVGSHPRLGRLTAVELRRELMAQAKDKFQNIVTNYQRGLYSLRDCDFDEKLPYY